MPADLHVVAHETRPQPNNGGPSKLTINQTAALQQIEFASLEVAGMINCGAWLRATGSGAGWNETCACLDLAIGCWRAGAAGDWAEQYRRFAERPWTGARCELLIVHSGRCGNDARGESATIKALERGAVNSASIMVLAHGFRRLRTNASASRCGFRAAPAADQRARVFPVGAGGTRDRVASLIDENGYFWHDWTAATRIDPEGRGSRARAQIERAYAMGIRPRIWIHPKISVLVYQARHPISRATGPTGNTRARWSASGAARNPHRDALWHSPQSPETMGKAP